MSRRPVGVLSRRNDQSGAHTSAEIASPKTLAVFRLELVDAWSLCIHESLGVTFFFDQRTR